MKSVLIKFSAAQALMERVASDYLKPQDAEELKTFFESEHQKVKYLVDRSPGTCVLGNGISVFIIPSNRHKIPRKVKVFRNPWEQTEQPEAIQALIEKAERKFPHLKGKIFYEPGVID